MSIRTPIHQVAKDLCIESNRVILACNSLGINAKGSSKRLNKEEVDKVLNHFKTGKNVSEEVVTIYNETKREENTVNKLRKKENIPSKVDYFSNRLIG